MACGCSTGLPVMTGRSFIYNKHLLEEYECCDHDGPLPERAESAELNSICAGESDPTWCMAPNGAAGGTHCYVLDDNRMACGCSTGRPVMTGRSYIDDNERLEEYE